MTRRGRLYPASQVVIGFGTSIRGLGYRQSRLLLFKLRMFAIGQQQRLPAVSEVWVAAQLPERTERTGRQTVRRSARPLFHRPLTVL